eukprot:5810871-Amphidinium_carterae.1
MGTVPSEPQFVMTPSVSIGFSQSIASNSFCTAPFQALVVASSAQEFGTYSDTTSKNLKVLKQGP